MSDTKTSWTVLLERHEYQTTKCFDDVAAAIRAGLGHPDFAALQRRLSQIESWPEVEAEVERHRGTSGLMTFLELDLGAVVTKAAGARPLKAVRFIAGNPVTMAAMTRSTPGAGAFAPVTILIFESGQSVRCRYDTITSALGGEMQDDARSTATQLDLAVLDLLAGAAGM